MAKLGMTFSPEINKAKMIVDAIDRRRREVCGLCGSAKGEASEMYYEGMRTALAEIQSYAEKVAALTTPTQVDAVSA